MPSLRLGMPSLGKELIRQGLKHIDAPDDGLRFELMHFLAGLADSHRQLDDAERFHAPVPEGAA